MEGILVSENGKATLPQHRFEEIISQRLGKGGPLDGWEAGIKKLDQADGLKDLIKMMVDRPDSNGFRWVLFKYCLSI